MSTHYRTRIFHFIKLFIIRVRNFLNYFSSTLSDRKKIGSYFITSIAVIVIIKVVLLQISLTWKPTKFPHRIDNFYLYHDFLFYNLPLVPWPWQDLRRPLIVIIGIYFPLTLYLFNWYNQNVIQIMVPYFFLLGAQASTMFVASNLLGPGALTFVGFLYSSVRSLQLIGLRNKNIDRCNLSSKKIITKISLLKNTISFFLIIEYILWVLNAIYLLSFIGYVSIGILGMGLTPRFTN
jgi:hypothetical protein